MQRERERGSEKDLVVLLQMVLHLMKGASGARESCENVRRKKLPQVRASERASYDDHIMADESMTFNLGGAMTRGLFVETEAGTLAAFERRQTHRLAREGENTGRTKC